MGEARTDARGEPAADPTAPIRVLLVDGHRLLAAALGNFLQADSGLDVVGVEPDPARALAWVGSAPPDVVLLSYPYLRQDDGRLVDALRAERPALKVIVLSGPADEEALLACVRSGAQGHVSRDRAPAHLARAIRRVHAGEVLFAPELLMRLLRRPMRADPPSQGALPTGPLTPREREVLQATAAGLSTEEIAEQLCIARHTVRTHVKKAMAKLGAHSKLEAILIAIRHGLITADEGDQPGSARSHR